MYLILMRSGECVPLDTGGRDSDRFLTPDGIKDAVSSALFLASLGIEPKAILSSPFRRTKETAEIISEHLPENPEVIVAPYIMPGAGVEELLRSVKSRTECGEEDWIIAVGHEPDIGCTAKELLGLANECFIPLEPASLIALHIHCCEGKTSGKIVFLFSPKAMRN